MTPLHAELPIRRNDRRDADAPRLFTTQAKFEALLALNEAVNKYYDALMIVEQAREKMIEAGILAETTK